MSLVVSDLAATIRATAAPQGADRRVRFDRRATVDDVSELGRRQMGIERW